MRLLGVSAAAGAAIALSAGLVACGGGPERASSPPNAGPRAATVAVQALPATLDPALATTSAERAIAVATQTPLLTYKRTAGDDAAQLEPALADDLPELSADERDYRFQLRRGLVYADGGLVKASDVERAIAHASDVAADPDLRSALESIIGAPSKDGQTLSGVRSDDRTGVIVVRLRRPDGRVPLALADPATAPLPALPRAGRAPASTGPLRIASHTARSVELAANPLRPTISTVPAARLAQISIVPRPRGRRGVTSAELRSGAVDLDTAVPSPSDGAVGGGVARVSGPSSSVVALYLPQAGPFLSRATRRALAAAIDLRSVGPGPNGGVRATCGLLPSFAVGAVERDPCPAPPVVAKDRPLAGLSIRVAAPADDTATAAVTVVVKAIIALGGAADVVSAADPAAALARGRADLAVARVTPRLPHPALWLAAAARLDRLLAREVPREAAGPLTGSGGRWSALERRAVDRAVAVPLIGLQRVVVAGPSIDRRTVLLHPVLGLDLAALDLA